LEAAQYNARRAEKQYDATDPDNRLVASELERRWGAADKAENLARCKSSHRQLPVRTVNISGACGGNEARYART
jgi:hypothetical protein